MSTRGQKRRRAPVNYAVHVCDCDQGHSSEEECREANDAAKEIERKDEMMEMHRDVTTRIIISNSETVTIRVGQPEERFTVHKDLLTLHSSRFHHILRFPVLGNATEPYMPLVEPIQFAIFMTWLYSGDTNDSVSDLDVSQNNYLESLWTVGCHLKCPRFQDYCMDELREGAKARINNKEEGPWPNVAEASIVYDSAWENSKLRKFAADCLARNNPFKQCSAGLENWKVLLKTKPELSLDVHVAGAKDWKGTQPWDAQWREEYTFSNEYLSLDEEWKASILKSATKKELERAADAGSVGNRLKLAALGVKDGSEME